MKRKDNLIMNQRLSVASLCACFILPSFLLLTNVCFSQEPSQSFRWPNGNKIAISLTFDDARASQVEVGTNLLNQYGVKATFYVVPAGVRQRLEGWKKAVASGHVETILFFIPAQGISTGHEIKRWKIIRSIKCKKS